MADMGGDVAQRLLPRELRNDPFAVVEDLQARSSLLANASNTNMPSPGIEAILHELGQGLARVGLTQREPADELEGIVNPHPPFLDIAVATLLLARLLCH